LAVAGRGGLGLLKVAPGRVVPEHGHAGAELTLVLRGSFHDATGRYLPGDVADLDETVEHKPIADPGRECICLVASERPSRFRGLLARLLQPLHGL
jgi:putative transcriptional regulator